MEQLKEYSFDTTVKVKPGQANAWVPAGQPIREEYVVLLFDHVLF